MKAIVLSVGLLFPSAAFAYPGSFLPCNPQACSAPGALCFQMPPLSAPMMWNRTGNTLHLTYRTEGPTTDDKGRPTRNFTGDPTIVDIPLTDSTTTILLCGGLNRPKDVGEVAQ